MQRPGNATQRRMHNMYHMRNLLPQPIQEKPDYIRRVAQKGASADPYWSGKPCYPRWRQRQRRARHRGRFQAAEQLPHRDWEGSHEARTRAGEGQHLREGAGGRDDEEGHARDLHRILQAFPDDLPAEAPVGEQQRVRKPNRH